jgi:uncharacterized protein YhbP (UPF0306 family)
VSKTEQIASLLNSENTLVLATLNADGTSRATPLFYLAGEDLQVYWFSSLSSQHSKNLKISPDAAAAVFRPTDDWKRICGVQMRGQVTLVRDLAIRRTIREAYADRFRLNLMLRTLMKQSGLFVFRPIWIRYLDNTRRFGYKFEINFLSK